MRDKIEKERELNGGTLSEFLNDAVKFYIDYLERKRYDEMQYQQSMRESDRRN